MPKDEAVPMTDSDGVLDGVYRAITERRAKNIRPLTEIRLTADQLDRLQQEITTVDGTKWPDLGPGTYLYGIPVVLVDDVEDSTPFERWHEQFLTTVRKVHI